MERNKNETGVPKPGQKQVGFFPELAVTLHDINHDQVLKN